ncbi:MAG: tyrosine-type recombinase/integrase [Sphingomonadaceae bacterium]
MARANGEGTVYQRKSDDKIVVAISLPGGGRKVFYSDENGLPFKTKAAGKAFLKKELEKLSQGLPLGPGEELGSYLLNWMETVARPRLDPKTAKDYAAIIRLHILPKLGSCPINKLSGPLLAELYTEKLKALSPRRVQYIHAVIHTAMEQAVKWRFIPRNPADDVEAPKVTKRDPHILSVHQVRQLLAAVQGDRLEALYVLAVTTAMRQGELLGLHWDEVDLARGMIHVVHSLDRLERQWRVKDPKTKLSRRSIRLTQWAVRALQDHWQRQQWETELAGELWQGRNLVFCRENGLPLDNKRVTERHFYRLLRKLNLPPMHFHDLRHTAASLYMLMGVPPKVVQEMLGHSTVVMTLDTYSHLLPEMQEEAVRKMDNLLGPGTNG